MKAIGIASLALFAGGCVLSDQARPEPINGDARFTCDAAPVQGMIGSVATTEVGSEAVRGARARTVRWIQPGMAVTQDFRQDRLNIEVDAQNRITAIRCG